MDGAAALLTEVELDGRKHARKAPADRPPARLILVGFLLAGVAFVCVTLVCAYRMREVSSESQSINANVFPRVVAVATLRERLRELMIELGRSIGSGQGATPDFDRLIGLTQQQEAALETLGGADQRDWLRARAYLDAGIDSARRALDSLREGEIVQARSLADSVAMPAADSADRELWQLQDRIASAGMQAAQHIERVRRSTILLSFGLDAFCIAIAAAFALVTVRAVRRHADLVEARAHELEQFAARIAHDIRGPLSPVLFALQTTSKAVSPEDARRPAVDRAIRSIGRVTTLIDDLLGFARAGGAIDPLGRASVLEVARAAVEDARGQAESRGIDLRVEAPAGDVTVACPAGVLMSLVSNLVRNAVKYMGAARERRVVVRVVRTGGDIRVEVADTGPGLPAEAVHRVFEPYVRADNSGQPGLGLGLATVKRFAGAYGGRVGVRSTSGGCTFWFELPALRVAGAREQNAAASAYTLPDRRM